MITTIIYPIMELNRTTGKQDSQNDKKFCLLVSNEAKQALDLYRQENANSFPAYLYYDCDYRGYVYKSDDMGTVKQVLEQLAVTVAVKRPGDLVTSPDHNRKMPELKHAQPTFDYNGPYDTEKQYRVNLWT